MRVDRTRHCAEAVDHSVVADDHYSREKHGGGCCVHGNCNRKSRKEDQNVGEERDGEKDRKAE